MKRGLLSKRSQITIFVIIAIVVAALSGFIIFREKIFPKETPSSLVPVYDYYLSCVKATAEEGANIMGSQAGYIEAPDFEPGSEHAPFSSQFEFMGLAVPYWYYISQNGIAKEQIPTEKQMQDQLSDYIENKIRDCSFRVFENQGFNITSAEEISAKTEIQENKIKIQLSQRLDIAKADERFSITSHSVEIDSRLGKFYRLAKKIYDYEKNKMFLENYSIDTLYTYAPVSGIIFNCSPAVWSPYEVIDRLKNALSANIQMIKVQGDYYTAKNPYTNYFIVAEEAGIDLENNQISFLYMPNWPSRFEVWPTKNNVMIAEPVGTQAGLGAMGFCYVPYKFVYDVYIPVLVQIYNPDDAKEIFQFPVAVVIKKNVPREAIVTEPYTEVEESACDRANTEIEIFTYNVNLEPVEADIEFKCMNDVCSLGKTKLDNETGYSMLRAMVPQCVNGFLTASAEGYKDKKQIISTNTETTADIVLDREYKLDLEVYVDNSLTKDLAVLTISEIVDNATANANSIAYPFTKQIDMAEGYYEFDLKVYGSGNLVIPAVTTKQCIKTPREGILGVFGFEEEKCFDVNLPSQTITNLLVAGGRQMHYLTPNVLEAAEVLRVYAFSVKKPTSLDEIQSSYDEVEEKGLWIELA